MSRRRSIGLGVALAIATLLAVQAWSYWPAVGLVTAVAGRRPWIGAGAGSPRTEVLAIPTRHGAVEGRLFRPDGTPALRLVVFPGVNAGGVDEPRFATMLSRLAAAGGLVLGVPLPDLRDYRITPRSTDVIEDATRWMTEQPDLAPDRQVNLVGVSFAGGLALVAAGRPSLAGRVKTVVSIGGHGDLPRVLAFFCTGLLPDGRARRPHDYGLALLVLEMTDRLVPTAEADGLTRAVRVFLDASGAEATDPERAGQLLGQARAMTEGLPDASRSIMRLVVARDVVLLGQRLRPLLPEVGAEAALSPERSPATEAPVFLIHGADDNVVPDMESARLARDLAGRRDRAPHVLVTSLLSHADLGASPGAADVWRVLRFSRAWLRAARARP